MSNIEQRVALVTGANKGIGYETASQLGRTGMTVLVGVRDAGHGENAAARLKADGIDAHSILLDVLDRATIDAAARHIKEAFGRLDILVNNAGVVSPADGPASSADVEQVRRVFDANFFGALEVVQVMLPLLRRAPSGRIVNVSSGLGSLARQSDPDWEFAAVNTLGYNASKAALNMLTVLLAKELVGTSIKVNSVAPGFTATDLNGRAQGAQTPAEGARASVLAALLPDVGPTGSFLTYGDPEPW